MIICSSEHLLDYGLFELPDCHEMKIVFVNNYDTAIVFYIGLN